MGKHDPAFTAPLDMDGAAVALGVSRRFLTDSLHDCA